MQVMLIILKEETFASSKVAKFRESPFRQRFLTRTNF